MANRWVELTMVCSCAISLGWTVTAWAQEGETSLSGTESSPTTAESTTEAVPTDPASAAVESIAPPMESSPAPSAVPGITANTVIPQLIETMQQRNEAIVPVPRPNRDPREAALDTSFPAEQPLADGMDPGDDPIPGSRRTQARTTNGVTEITNRDIPVAEKKAALVERPNDVKNSLGQPLAHTASFKANTGSPVILPLTKAQRPSFGGSPWLWILAGTAALLLVPIAVLLTRPTRQK